MRKPMMLRFLVVSLLASSGISFSPSFPLRWLKLSNPQPPQRLPVPSSAQTRTVSRGTSYLRETTTTEGGTNGVAPTETPTLDVSALFKYAVALVTQFGLLTATACSLDKLIGMSSIGQVPFGINVALFYATALKSRIFNPLSNTRPQPATLETTQAEQLPERVRPSWTPPGFVFPIMWLLIIAPIRATTAAMVYHYTESYANPAILALLFHLSVGDVWNTINNVDRRLGFSAAVIPLVWLSKAYAAYSFYNVIPMAGKLLGGTLIWFSVATALIVATWRLNPDDEGKLDPLYPVKGAAETQFVWFRRKN